MAMFFQFSQDPIEALGNLLKARQRANKTKIGMRSPAFKGLATMLWVRMMPMALHEPQQFDHIMVRFRHLMDPKSQVPDAIDVHALMWDV